LIGLPTANAVTVLSEQGNSEDLSVDRIVREVLVFIYAFTPTVS
jgi:hypothetical protein